MLLVGDLPMNSFASAHCIRDASSVRSSLYFIPLKKNKKNFVCFLVWESSQLFFVFVWSMIVIFMWNIMIGLNSGMFCTGNRIDSNASDKYFATLANELVKKEKKVVK